MPHNHLVAAITGRFDIEKAIGLPSSTRICLTTCFEFEDEEVAVEAFGYGDIPDPNERVQITSSRWHLLGPQALL